MTAMSRRYGVKSLLVEPYKQVKIGVIFLGINILFALLILGIFGYYIVDIYQAMSYYFSLQPEENRSMLMKFSFPIGAGIIVLIAFILSTLYTSIHYTHQIYGPLVSIHRFLDTLLQNKKPVPLQLRESDQFKELALKLNEIGERLSRRELDQQMIEEFDRSLDAILSKSPLPDGWVDEADEYYKEIYAKLKLIKEKNP